MSISITGAFGADEINLAGVILDEEQEQELQQWLDSVIDEEGSFTRDDVINLAGLAFVAGRCFQSQFSGPDTVQVEMDAMLLSKFLQFVVAS